jgi:hypothetical protein
MFAALAALVVPRPNETRPRMLAMENRNANDDFIGVISWKAV